MTVRTAQALALMSCLCLAGCGASQTTEINSAFAETAAGETATTSADAPPAGDVELAIESFDGIKQRVASKRGKVVVMDAWSTACPPCLKDFHNLVELHKQYGPEDLACISLSFDYEGIGKPEDVRDPVLSFLRAQGAVFDNLMSSEESDTLYRKFKLNSVPAIFVYDRAGNLKQRFDNEGAYDEVRTLVAELVKEQPPAAPAK